MKYIVERISMDDCTHWAWLMERGGNGPYYRLDVTKMDVFEGQTVGTHWWEFPDIRIKPKQLLKIYE